MPVKEHLLSFTERALLTSNPTAQRLFAIMESKQTNLAVAADVNQAEDLLYLAEALGPEICVFKTHVDIIRDFTPSMTQRLQELEKKHQFLIFEDRKFADIGNTVKQQYADGIYRIADWADITNAHSVPGPGIIQGLREIGLPLGRGLLLLAEMSSKGSLASGNYTEETLRMAKEYPDFVFGFIARRRLDDDPRFVTMTPGVNLSNSGDALGQQYLTPEVVIRDHKSDIIIVGRDIIQAQDPAAAARKYRNAGWAAYKSLF